MVEWSGRYLLVGITSFALVDCESPFPSVFARLGWSMKFRRNFTQFFEISKFCEIPRNFEKKVWLFRETPQKGLAISRNSA
jgi:hypothetical protein